MHNNNSPLAGPGSGYTCTSSKVFRTKLSKRFFLSIPAGHILESNCYSSPHVPIVLEQVRSSTKEREKQWLRIVAAGASSRLCNVYVPDFID